jgi:IS4 transposase
VLREVRYRIGTPGFRSHQITLVTTRLDAEVYGVDDLAKLYRRRWQVETSLAHLKTTIQGYLLLLQLFGRTHRHLLSYSPSLFRRNSGMVTAFRAEHD